MTTRKIETWPDWIIYQSSVSLFAETAYISDFRVSITRSVLTVSSWNLQIRWTWMKSWVNLKSVPIKLFILDLRPLDCWKCPFSTFNFDQIVLNLTYKMGFETWCTVRPWGETGHIVLRLKCQILIELYVKSYVLQINECCRHWVTMAYSSAQVRIKDHYEVLFFLSSAFTYSTVDKHANPDWHRTLISRHLHIFLVTHQKGTTKMLPPCQDISNEYPQHMFLWSVKKNIYLIPLLSWAA